MCIRDSLTALQPPSLTAFQPHSDLTDPSIHRSIGRSIRQLIDPPALRHGGGEVVRHLLTVAVIIRKAVVAAATAVMMLAAMRKCTCTRTDRLISGTTKTELFRSI